MNHRSCLASLLAAVAVCTLAPLALAAPAAAAGDQPTPPTPQVDEQRSADATSVDAARAAAERARVQMEAARKKLEEAAHEIAELSLRGMVYLPGEIPPPSRSIIGAALDLRDSTDGLSVRSVSPGGPAAEAGLHGGDVITSINGVDVHDRRGARAGLAALAELNPNSKVTLKLMRDGKPLELTVTTRAAPAGSSFGGVAVIPPIPPIPPIPAMPDMPRLPVGGLADLELATLTPQLGHYFGAEKGVLVVRAPAGGTLGLQDGDVIVSIDGREAANSSQVSRIVASYQAGEKFTLRIIRDHKPLSLDVTVPAGHPRNPGRRGYFYEAAPPKDPFMVPVHTGID